VAELINKFALMLARGLHHAYKLLISPFLGQRCRFEPYCSDYALEAIEKHGFFCGCLLAAKRVVRCNPWFQGGLDPVPPVKKK
jgi:putative membrane protein insertion efficiency factor